MRNITLLIIILLILSGCGAYGDDCSGGPIDCVDETVSILSIDSDFFPLNIRQQLVFVPNDSSIELVGYTNGREFRNSTLVVGEKHETIKCGDGKCDYNLRVNYREIDYTGDLNTLLIFLACDADIHTPGKWNYGKYSYTSVKRNYISILGQRFHFASPDFNALDSNQILFHPTLSINSVLYNNVYELIIDSNKVLSGKPYKCYYSVTDDGIIGFDTRNGPYYRRKG